MNCRGATWWGLTNPEPNWPLTETVRGYTARFSYGVENRGRMLWLIKKGNVMEVGKIERLQLDVSFKLDLFSIGTLNLEEQIYFCDDDDPPYKREMSTLPGIIPLSQVLANRYDRRQGAIHFFLHNQTLKAAA